MKKLALSLVLTLGVSGVALANNGNGEKERQPVKKETVKKEIVEKKDIKDSCFHTYATDVYDCEGNKTRFMHSSQVGDCGGTPDGGLIMHFESLHLSDLGLC